MPAHQILFPLVIFLFSSSIPFFPGALHSTIHLMLHGLQWADLAPFMDSPIRELVRRELTSRRDGAVSSSSCLEIIVLALLDEEIPEFPPQPIPSDLVAGERSAPQPGLDSLFGVLPTKSDVKSITRMISSCGMSPS